MAQILLVDDDAHVRSALARALRHRGHEIEEADNGSSALGKLGGSFPAVVRDDAPDIIIVDLVMPGMDGLELIRAIRARSQAVRIIAISGGCFGELSYLKTAEDFGADMSFAKPVRVARLAEAVDLLTGETPAGPAFPKTAAC